jgi:hypothetical protein
VSLVNAFNYDGTDASGNISSVGVSGNIVLITFNNPFTELIAVEVNITNGYFQSLPAISVLQATTPWAVSGAFFQATQPVSNAGTFPVQVTNFPATVAVTQSTSPWVVSLASTTITGTVAVTQSTTPWSVTFPTPQHVINDASSAVIGHVITDTGSTVAVSNFPASQVVTLVSTTITGTVAVTAPTLTKGTQGANGFSVQALHDAGRNSRAFMLDAITAATATEALVSVVQWYGNAAVAGTTQPAVVPAGKTLRLTSWKIQHQAISQPGYAVVRLRVNTGGVAVLASPLAWSFEAGAGTAANTSNVLAGTVTTETGDFPEGFEIPAGSGVGFTLAGYGATGTLALDGGVRFAVFGYEY